ncbi:hypothetical protein [Bacillus toyonensis]|uniref:hypothetical protein n=1 Tax=Bacillus toyonensis TaxID=155322 RepID=UPI00027BEAB4|nr:hypothetical protein [Bacillus toyonensis]EJV41788.1 hypothetical protein IEA_05673 [Bacillus toyonensis]
MSTLTDYLEKFIPSEDAAKVHIKLTIKNYRPIGEEVLNKQLKLVQEGLEVAGFPPITAQRLIIECVESENA